MLNMCATLHKITTSVTNERTNQQTQVITIRPGVVNYPAVSPCGSQKGSKVSHRLRLSGNPWRCLVQRLYDLYLVWIRRLVKRSLVDEDSVVMYSTVAAQTQAARIT